MLEQNSSKSPPNSKSDPTFLSGLEVLDDEVGLGLDSPVELAGRVFALLVLQTGHPDTDQAVHGVDDVHVGLVVFGHHTVGGLKVTKKRTFKLRITNI